MPDVIATRLAAQQISGLRGRRLKVYEEFERQLAAKGCAAMEYRLTGSDPLPRLCVRHLYGSDRAVVAFHDGQAWVLLVAPHDAGDAARDVYSSLYELLGLAPPSSRRTKPPCCREQDGQPPQMDEAIIDDLVARTRALFGR